jgi:predicted dehydrogenase
MSVGDSLRVGVIGLGKMGLLHAGVLNTLPGVELAAICEKSSFIRRIAKKAIRNVSIVGDVGALSGLGLDAVYITTPTPSHYVVARQVYDEGLARHVFVEKPLTSKYVDSRALCDLAERGGGANMVGYLRRFMVTFMKTKELLSQGVIGEPAFFEVKALSSDFVGAKPDSKASMTKAGVLSDLGSYAVYLSLWFFGDLQVGSAKVDSLVGSGGEDSVRVDVSQRSGGLGGQISASWCVEGYRMPEVNMSIKGSEGLLEANDDEVRLKLNDGEKRVWFRHDLIDFVGFWLGLPEYYREDAHFVGSIRSGSAARPSFREASDVDLFIDNVRQRAEQH